MKNWLKSRMIDWMTTILCQFIPMVLIFTQNQRIITKVLLRVCKNTRIPLPRRWIMFGDWIPASQPISAPEPCLISLRSCTVSAFQDVTNGCGFPKFIVIVKHYSWIYIYIHTHVCLFNYLPIHFSFISQNVMYIIYLIYVIHVVYVIYVIF